jgi:hypothetical protein
MKNKENTKIKLIGRREFIDLPELNLSGMEAKIDTGAYTTSIHCENIVVNYEMSKAILYFTIEPGQQIPFKFEDFGKKKIKNSFGEMEERYVIKTFIKLGGKKIRTTISLSNRDNMRYPVLIGRRLIKGKFLIDPNQLHTGGISLQSIFNTIHSN